MLKVPTGTLLTQEVGLRFLLVGVVERFLLVPYCQYAY